MPKRLTPEDIVRKVALAKIHLGCAIDHLEVLAQRMEVAGPRPAGLAHELRDEIDALAFVNTALKKSPWSAPAPPG